MKKSKIVLSVIALLSFCISACNKQSASSEEPSSKKEESSVTSVSSSQDPSSEVESSEPVSSLSSTSEEISSIEESSEIASSEENSSEESSEESSEQISSNEPQSSGPEIIEGDNFTITIPEDLSMMSSNCKQYVDDMRAQQKMLIDERGQNADYYLNDLYGFDGVDITKGIPDGDSGGYRPANHESEYLDDVAARWEDGEKSDENKGIRISFTPSDALKNKEYTFTYSVNADLSGAKTITTTNTSVLLKNLLVNQRYFFKVEADGEESDILDFQTGDYPRWIDARPMFNVRDAGGYVTKTGQRIKQGMVFRGGEITPAVGWKANSYSSYTGDVGGRYTGSNGKMVDEHITTQTADSKKVFREDMNMVNGLEIDLRSSGERNNYTACGFAENGDINYKLLSISSYDNGMKNNKSEIKQVFEAFAQADEHPVYYHCYGGADRTGVVGFMLGAVLGMSYTDLVIDFELTSYSSNPSRNYRSHLRSGPYNYWPRMLTYLQDTLHWSSNKTIQESMEEFLVNDCKVSQNTIDTIKDIMLEPLK